jgi:hypothetical protein
MKEYSSRTLSGWFAMNAHKIVFQKAFELSECDDAWEVESVSAGPREELVITAVTRVDPALRANPDRLIQAFYQQRRRYLVLPGRGEKSQSVVAPERLFLHIQPFGPEAVLLVEGRCRSGDNNAKITTKSGEVLSTFHAGDGINDVRVTPENKIWVSYFDEGVFGSTVAQAGLARFSSEGKLEFNFNESALKNGIPDIADCYALNVCNGEVFLYYYTDFPLVRIKNDRAEIVCQVPVAGSRAFAFFGDYALFSGSYEKRETLFLLHLSEGNVNEIEPFDENGKRLEIRSASGKGSRLYLVDSRSVYSADLSRVPR